MSIISLYLLDIWMLFFFFLDRQEQVIGTSYSSILLQTHRNPWGSSALVFEYLLLYFFIVIILIKLFVDRKNKNNMWLRPQAVLRVLCFLGGRFFYSFIIMWMKQFERIKFREISELCKCFLIVLESSGVFSIFFLFMA